MSEHIKIYYLTNLTPEEYVKDLVPFSKTANKAEALCTDLEADTIDYATCHDVVQIIEKIINEIKSTDMAISIDNDADINFLKIMISGAALAIEHSTSIIPSYVEMSATNYLINILKDEMPDVIARTSMRPSSLSKVIDDFKESLGIKTPISPTGDIDQIIEEINTKTKAEIVKPKETLKDYICSDLLHEELDEVVGFFANAKTYKDANVEIPKGILFKGPWGTGKTYAARCIAGTVDCYFMTCTASALQGMYIGSGAENIRAMFKGAKLLAEKSKKGVIIFIDELDSFGDRQRHGGGGADGEEDRTLNQLLAEMSGFENNGDILVLAATNFPERLDSALMRSGRFGRQITIDYPNEDERLALLTYYFGRLNLPLDSSANIHDITDLTRGLTPADIKEIVNESGILSIRQSLKTIPLKNVNEAINKVITKNIRHPDGPISELTLVAAHECGHVLAEVYYNNTFPIKVTNYSYGDAGGFTQSGELFNGLVKQRSFKAQIKMLLGGRAAEEVIVGYITSGASSDLEKAKSIMKSYYVTYNFESFDVEKIDQLVLDKVNEYYNEIVEDFKRPEFKAVLQSLTDDLVAKRVLYTSDIGILVAPLRESIDLYAATEH